jgi:hypothetical protein
LICLTAFEDNAATLEDTKLLDRSTALGRVLVTSDKNFLGEAKRRQTQGIELAGVIFAHPLIVSMRTWIDDLEIISEAGEPLDLGNAVQHVLL